jgi:hypothetical protein
MKYLVFLLVVTLCVIVTHARSQKRAHAHLDDVERVDRNVRRDEEEEEDNACVKVLLMYLLSFEKSHKYPLQTELIELSHE